MSKRLTAAERQEREYRDRERYERQFLRELESATTLEQLWKLANRTVSRAADPYHHWLGCELHHNPYDKAPAHVASAIRAAVERARQAPP